MRRLIKASFAAYYWIKVENRIWDKNYSEALSWLDKCITAGVYNYKVSMVRAFTLVALSRFSEARDEIKLAVGKADSSSSLNEDEKRYLKAYGTRLLRLCPPVPGHRVMTDFTFDENCVRRNIKSNFPLSAL